MTYVRRIDIYMGLCNEIESELLKAVVKGFCKELYDTTYEFRRKSANTREIERFIENIKQETLYSFNWGYLNKSVMKYKNIRTLYIRFYRYLIKNNNYIADDKDLVCEKIWILNSFNASQWLDKIFYPNSDIRYFYVKDIDYYGGGKRRKLVNFNTKDVFLQELLKEYMQFLSVRTLNSDGLFKFIYNFSNSVKYLQVSGIDDFNFNTFRHQYRFYKRYGLKLKKNYKMKSFIINFYIFICNKVENEMKNKSVFNIGDDIDLNCLYRSDFSKLYDNGYKLILYNRFDVLPKNDKWILAPNNYIHDTTRINNYNYRTLDFTTISDLKERKYIKMWFWNSNISLSTKYGMYCNIIEFVSIVRRNRLILNYSLVEHNSNEYITISDLKIYISILRNKGYSRAAINGKVLAVKQYCRYLNENSFECINQFKLRILQSKSVNSTPNPIEKDKKIIIDQIMNENNSTVDQKLFNIVYKLLLITPLRPSEILNLKVNCISSQMSHGKFTLNVKTEESKEIYKVNTITKVSKGEKINISIGEYAKRSIEEAIKITSDIRANCKPDMNKYIFLTKRARNRTMVLRAKQFSDYFRRILDQVGLKDKHTSYNLRDTYITTAFEVVEKAGGDILELNALTLHKNIDTTNKHYCAYRNRKYLEGAYGVTLDNIIIKGKVISSDYIRDNNYNNMQRVENCGYCESKQCTGVECLICKNFVTTTAEKNNFIKMIDHIDKEILLEKNSHDKEKMLVIKKLYVKYLEEIICQEQN